MRCDEDTIMVKVNEYLTLYATEANDMLTFETSSDVHWHMETEKVAHFIIDILKGNYVIIESLFIFRKIIPLNPHYKVIKKEKYEKIKGRYLGKNRVRIYTGNSIIQRAN